MLIRRCLREVKPDLVHAWGTEDGAALVASRLRYPFLVTVQGLMGWYVKLVRPNVMVRLAARLEPIALARCRTVTAESTFSANYVRQHFPRLDVRHVDVVPDELFHRVQRRPEIQPPRFLYLGSVGFAKGGDLLVRALDKLQQGFSLTVIGRKDRQLMEKVGFGDSHPLWLRTQFREHLPPQGVAEELARATVMICPTRADTGPLAVKEAAVAGVPVVGSDVGGMPDYVVPGKNGLLFPSGDADACAQTVATATLHPLFGRGQVDPLTLAELRARLSPVRMAGQFLEIYLRLAGRSS